MKTYVYLWSYLAQSFLQWAMFQTKTVEKSKHNSFQLTFLFFLNCTVYKIRKNFVEPDRSIQRMHFACWLTKAIYTHSEYVTGVAFPRQQWKSERASMLRYMQIACLVCIVFKFRDSRSTPLQSTTVFFQMCTHYWRSAFKLFQRAI
jgi:hypothetical protein